VRIRATSANSAIPVFVGIATTDAASHYLTGVQYATVRNPAGHGVTYIRHSGAGPATLPATARLWTAHADGTGTQTLTWQVVSGGWTVVAMNADGSRPVQVRVNVAAQAAVTAVGRRRPADGRGDLPGRRCRPDRGSTAPRVAGQSRQARLMRPRCRPAHDRRHIRRQALTGTPTAATPVRALERIPLWGARTRAEHLTWASTLGARALSPRLPYGCRKCRHLMRPASTRGSGRRAGRVFGRGCCRRQARYGSCRRVVCG
jgi:hypothetical protein